MSQHLAFQRLHAPLDLLAEAGPEAEEVGRGRHDNTDQHAHSGLPVRPVAGRGRGRGRGMARRPALDCSNSSNRGWEITFSPRQNTEVHKCSHTLPPPSQTT